MMNKKGRNPCGSISCFSRGHSRKRGTTEWTMAKLMTLVLAVFLIVIIIYGVQNKGFGPLWDNIEARYNEVLIFMGVRDDGVPKCGDAFDESIDGMKGKFYPCENKCDFVIEEPKELLDFTNFTIKGDSISVVGVGISDNDEAYRFGSAEAEKHREAFKLLNDTVGEFLLSEGMSYKDFVKVMEFGAGMTFDINVDGAYDTIYSYDGQNWIKSNFWVGGSGREIILEEDVISEVWSNYPRNPINWNYKGDGDSMLIVTDYNENVGNIKHSREEIKKWLDELIEKEKKIKDRAVTLEIHKDGSRNTFFRLNDGEFFLEDEIIDKSVVSNNIYTANSKGILVDWTWRNVGAYDYAIVSDEEIQKIKNPMNLEKDRFSRWLVKTRKGWDTSNEDQDKLLVPLSDYVGTYADVKFVEESVKIRLDGGSTLDRGPFSVVGDRVYYNEEDSLIELDKKKDGEYLMEFGIWNQNIGLIKDGKITAYRKSNPWSFSPRLREILTELESDYVFNGVDFIRSSDGEIPVDANSVFSEERYEVPLIFFRVSSGEIFGLYYKDGKPTLFHNTEDSIVSDFVSRSDEDWEEFLKINKIYENFKVRRCGRK